MTQADRDTPSPRIRSLLVTALVRGEPRHRVPGIDLRHGQTPESLDEKSRKKLRRVAGLYGLDLARFKDWWWFTPGDENGPTDHQLAAGVVELKEGKFGGAQYVARRFDEPLDWYAKNGHITPRQRRAGKRYYSLWFQAGYRSAPVISRYGLRAGGERDPKELEKASLDLRAARAAIRGVRERQIAYNVCCMGDRAGRRGQMALLRSALDDLAEHFGYK